MGVMTHDSGSELMHVCEHEGPQQTFTHFRLSKRLLNVRPHQGCKEHTFLFTGKAAHQMLPGWKDC